MAFYLYLHDRVAGPYGVDELKDMVTHREVTEKTAACREGETEWSTVGEVLGADIPKAKGGSPVSMPTQMGREAHGRHERVEREIHRGIDRSTYFFVCLVVGVGSWLADRYLGAPIYYLPRVAAAVLVTLGVTIARAVNMGKSWWWALLVFVPVFNLYVWFLCLAAQSGYQRAGRLDRAGRSFFFVLVAAIILFLALVLFNVIRSTQAPW